MYILYTECMVLHCALKNTVLDYINTACSSKVIIEANHIIIRQFH